MAQSRREFLKTTSAAAAALGLTACGAAQRPVEEAPSPVPSSNNPAAGSGDPSFRELALLALDAAKASGASYADVRISRNRNQRIFTRERRVQGITDRETFGFGVRLLVDGAWGFAASRDLTRDEVPRVAKQAVAQARATGPRWCVGMLAPVTRFHRVCESAKRSSMGIKKVPCVAETAGRVKEPSHSEVS